MVEVALKRGASEVYRPTEALRRAVLAIGNNVVADLLGVNKSQPGRWLRGQERMSAVNAAAVVELDAFLGRVLQAFTPEQAVLWLTGSDHVLAGARPVDAFKVRGLAAVLPAIHAHEQGAFA